MSKLKLERTIASYEGMIPEAVAAGSHAQILFALRDARKDILALSNALNTRPTPDPCDELVTYDASTIMHSIDNHPLTPNPKGTWVTRQNAEEVIAAKDARIAELERLLGLAQSVHSWNIDASGDGILYVCKDDHDKSEPCEWNAFIPIERAEAENKRLRDALVMIARIELSFPSEFREIARAALGEVSRD